MHLLPHGTQPALKVGILGPIPFIRKKLFSVILGAVHPALQKDELPGAEFLRTNAKPVHQ